MSFFQKGQFFGPGHDTLFCVVTRRNDVSVNFFILCLKSKSEMEEFYFSELKLSQIVIKILIDVQCKENGQTFFT